MFIILPNKARLAVAHIVSYEPHGTSGVHIETIAGAIILENITVERLDAAIARINIAAAARSPLAPSLKPPCDEPPHRAERH
jgi:hypothetical protein